jgi:hypothetical protein
MRANITALALIVLVELQDISIQLDHIQKIL